jgi:hypothetical protein
VQQLLLLALCHHKQAEELAAAEVVAELEL